MRFITPRRIGIGIVAAVLFGALATATAAAPGTTLTARMQSAPAQRPANAVVHVSAGTTVNPDANSGCKLAQPQPGVPLQMNLVGSGGLFKTVAMEKEIFDCTSPASGTITVISDVETFIEIVERNTSLVEIRTEIATCNKNFVTGTILCRTVPLQLGKTAAPLQGCNPATETAPFAPVVMNTVISGVVKTMKVEKEIFQCTPIAGTAPMIGDVYVFTEIDEARTTLATGVVTYRDVAHKFMGVVCYKQESTASVAACNQFTP